MSRLLDRPRKLMITGGTSGVGAALTRALLTAEHQVVVMARKASVMPAAPGLFAYDCDLSNPDQILEVSARVSATHPDLSILINNAGVQHALGLLDTASTPRMLQDEVMVNLLAPALLTRALLPGMIALGSGAVVNISSGLAFFPKERAGLYAASKAGLHSFTQSLRFQTEQKGVAVVEVVLSLVDTPMTAGRGKGKISADAAAAAILKGLAAGKPVIWVGAARAMPLIHSFAPWLGRRLLRGT